MKLASIAVVQHVSPVTSLCCPLAPRSRAGAGCSSGGGIGVRGAGAGGARYASIPWVIAPEASRHQSNVGSGSNVGAVPVAADEPTALVDDISPAMFGITVEAVGYDVVSSLAPSAHVCDTQTQSNNPFGITVEEEGHSSEFW